MRISPLWVPVCLAVVLAGCGQKGPLVHPDAPKHKKAVPSPRPPAASVPAAPTAPDAPAPDANPPDAAASKP